MVFAPFSNFLPSTVTESHPPKISTVVLLLIEQDHIICNEVEFGFEALREVFKGAPTIKANMRQIANIVPLTESVYINHLLGHDTQPTASF